MKEVNFVSTIRTYQSKLTVYDRAIIHMFLLYNDSLALFYRGENGKEIEDSVLNWIFLPFVLFYFFLLSFFIFFVLSC